MKICIECGKEVAELYDGLCRECYIKSYTFTDLPGRIYLTTCPKCGRVRYKNSWREESIDNAIRKAIKGSLTVAPELEGHSISLSCRVKGKSVYICTISITGTFKGLEITEEKITEIIVKKELCRSCSRKAGHYFEAILQIRGDRRVPTDKEMNEIIDEIKENMNNLKKQGKEIFITKIVPTRGGVDIYISDRGFTKKMVQALHNKLGGTIKTTSKQSGMKDGRTQYRMTYLLRLPYYRKGDFVSKGEKLLYVKSIERRKVQLVDMDSWERKVIDDKMMDELKMVGNYSILKEAVVVSQSENEAQILDPYTFATVDVKKPHQIKLEKTIKIVKWKDRIYLFPYQDL